MTSGFRQFLSEYANSAETEQDVDTLLSTFTSLRTVLSPYVWNDGTATNLLCIQGTIPIVYRRVVYNVPIEFWLPHAYPRTAPIVYVRPTKTMVIKPGQYLDTNGKVNHPSVSNWTRSHDRSLVRVAGDLQQVFSLEPPVYSTQASASSHPSPQPPRAMAAANASHAAEGLQHHMNGTARPAHPPTRVSMPRPTTFRDELMQKVTRKLYDSLVTVETSMAKELSTTDSVQMQLRQNAQLVEISLDALKNRKEDLDRRRKQCEQIVEMHKDIANEVEEYSTDVEEMVVASRTAYGQLMEVLSDDLAIDDVIFQLGKALEKQRVDLHTYMKSVRSLAADQFFCRLKALNIQKLAATAENISSI